MTHVPQQNVPLPQPQPGGAVWGVGHPFLEAFENDHIDNQNNKVYSALVAVMVRVEPLSTAFKRSVRRALRDWSDADITLFYTTTYSFLRAYYLTNDIPMMRQVLDDIINGLV